MHSLLFFCYSCTCKMLTRTFICLLRNTISRSLTVMFLAIFQHARPEDSFAKSTSLFVPVRPIHNLVCFRCSFTFKKLMRTFLCLLRNFISRFFTEMFLAIFQSTVPEKDAQIYEQQTPREFFTQSHSTLPHNVWHDHLLPFLSGLPAETKFI